MPPKIREIRLHTWQELGKTFINMYESQGLPKKKHDMHHDVQSYQKSSQILNMVKKKQQPKQQQKTADVL